MHPYKLIRWSFCTN